jgi:RNA polymerase-binding transcription factor DksA
VAKKGVAAKKVTPKAGTTKVATKTQPAKTSKPSKATKTASTHKSSVSAKSPSRSGTKTGESVPKRPVKAGNEQAGASKPAISKPVSKAQKVTKAAPAKSTTTKVAAAKAAPSKDATSKAVSAVKKAVGKASASAKAPAKQAAKEPAPAPKVAATKVAKAATQVAEPTPDAASPVTLPAKADGQFADTSVAQKASKASKAPAKATPPTTPKGGPGPYATEPKFLEEQHKMLLEERETYQGQMTDLRAEAESLALEREPGDVQFDEESGEGGTVAVDRERDLTLAAQAQNTIAQIDMALASIADKTYGVCENCRQAVPKARLRALPYVRLCMACKSGGLHRR